MLPHRPKHVVQTGRQAGNVQEAGHLGTGEVMLVNPRASEVLEPIGGATVPLVLLDGCGVGGLAWVLVGFSEVELDRGKVGAHREPRVADETKCAYRFFLAPRDKQSVRGRRGGLGGKGSLGLEKDILRLRRALSPPVLSEKRAEWPVADLYVDPDRFIPDLFIVKTFTKVERRRAFLFFVQTF